jgi:poly-beta-1,6-N-acetyl-D-glucosamine biosynthesis protein PgaD
VTVRSRLPEVHGTLIFEATWAGTISQKLATVGFSAAFWAIWFTMWLPLFTVVIWVAAPIYGTEQALPQWEDAATTLGLILLTGIAMGSFLGLWGALQTIVGQNTPRARRPVDIQVDELAQWHQVDETLLRQAWRCRRLVIHHDGDGQVTDIEATLPRHAELRLVQPDQVPTLTQEVALNSCPDVALSTSEGSPAKGYHDHVTVNGVLVWEPPSERTGTGP